MAEILIVDDEQDICEMLAYNIKKEGHTVEIANNANEAFKHVEKHRPDLILLDVMMPGIDGIEFCEQLKSKPENKNILVCFLTARNEDYSQIAGLEAGGDDYVAKPIRPKVLMSRISALLRRSSENKTSSSDSVQNNQLIINRERYLVEKNGTEIILPRKEFELLALLASRPNAVFKRDVILEKVWGSEIVVGDRTIDVHIRKLREKIGEEHISTVKGIGYKFVE